jgi:hypothetical protein
MLPLQKSIRCGRTLQAASHSFAVSRVMFDGTTNSGFFAATN